MWLEVFDPPNLFQLSSVLSVFREKSVHSFVFFFLTKKYGLGWGEKEFCQVSSRGVMGRLRENNNSIFSIVFGRFVVLKENAFCQFFL